MKKTIYILLFSIILHGTPLAGNSAPDIHTYINTVFRQYRAGKTLDQYTAIKRLLLQYPSHHLSALFYSDLYYFSQIVGNKETAALIDKIITKCREQNALASILLLNIEKEKILYSIDPAKAGTVSPGLNPVRNWTIWGPYHKYGGSDIEHAFLPELLQFKPGGQQPGSQIHSSSITGEIDPAKKIYQQKGIVYASSSIACNRPFKIRIYAKTTYKFFINGKPVLSETGHASDVSIVQINRKGQYTLAIKMEHKPSWKFRIILTDIHDKPIIPKYIFNKNFTDTTFHYTLPAEYPYNKIQNDPDLTGPGKNMFLGHHFLNHNDQRAIDRFREAQKTSPTPFNRYFLALSLVHFSKDRNSAGYLEGWKILTSLKNNKKFIPVRILLTEDTINSGQHLTALHELEHLITQMPFNIKAYDLKLRLLDTLGYRNEFNKTLIAFKKAFPGSVLPYYRNASFNRQRNKIQYETSLKQGLELVYSNAAAMQLLDHYIMTGQYQKALSTITQYDHDGIFTDKKIFIYLKTGNIEQAKKLIFNMIVQNGAPKYYYILGRINFNRKQNPVMYWQKAVTIKPSLFSLDDYLRFAEQNNYENPITVDPEPYPGQTVLKKLSGSPSTILKQDRIFHLKPDGSSKIFCRDMVFINDESAISKWGEYKIPFNGTVELIMIRVTTENNRYYDSYTFHTVNDNKYISINGLSQGSILTVAYTVNNGIIKAKNSVFFAPRSIPLQHYDEPVISSTLRIIAPKKMPLYWHINKAHTAVETASGENKILTFSIKDIPGYGYEKYSGSNNNTLLHFKFTGMQTLDDFRNWYQGLLPRSTGISKRIKKLSLGKKSLEQTIHSVYDYVSSAIRLQNNILYYPEDPADVLYNKKGTPEDKALLAKTIFDHYGIKSYLAFSKNKYAKNDNTIIHPDMFSHILLYVPVDADNRFWLDFSNEHYSCGTVSNACDGSTAVIFLKQGPQKITVHSRLNDYEKTTITMAVDKNGNGDCSIESSFHGIYCTVKKYFTNTVYHDQNIARFYSNYIPLFELNSFSVSDIKAREKPLKINASGLCHGIAIIRNDKLVIEPVIKKSHLYNYTGYQSREHPLSIPKIGEEDRYIYLLPAGFNSHKINIHRTIKSIFGEARFSFIKHPGSNKLIIHKTIAVDSMLISSDQYQKFLQFCRAVKKIENKNLVLYSD